MKLTNLIVVAALLLGVVVAASVPLIAGEHENEGTKDKKIVSILAKIKLSLADAAGVAEKKTGGKAFKAQLEADDDEIIYEVGIVIVKDGKVSFRIVDVDAITGKVLDDEAYRGRGEHDDDDEDDDEDDDD